MSFTIAVAPRITVGSIVPTKAVFRTIPVVSKPQSEQQQQPVDVDAASFFRGRRVLLLGMPGPFTPTCHQRHLSAFVKHSDDISRNLRLDEIAVTCAFTDAWVMQAWAKESQVDSPLNRNKSRIKMLADGSGEFAATIGLLKDNREGNMGFRSLRYALLIDDGVVKYFGVDEARGSLENSGAELFMSSPSGKSKL